MTITSSTDRVTGTTVSTFVGNGRKVIAIGSGVGKTLPIRLERDGDAVRIVGTRARRLPERNFGLHRRFFWRVRARFGADWSRMTDAQVAREMRMVSNRRAH
jgi:hypothetical protein